MKTMKALFLASCALLLAQAVLGDDDHECNPGDTKRDNCNSCFCTQGNWACTLMACPREIRDVSNRGDECRDGYRKKVDCNDCTCKNGYWACTRKACDGQHLEKRDVAECHHGETKQEDCNRCACANGRWACTRRFCPKFKREVSTEVLADLKNVPCAPNDSFLIDCNRCQCNFERTGYTCTKFECGQEGALSTS